MPSAPSQCVCVTRCARSPFQLPPAVKWACVRLYSLGAAQARPGISVPALTPLPGAPSLSSEARGRVGARRARLHVPTPPTHIPSPTLEGDLADLRSRRRRQNLKSRSFWRRATTCTSHGASLCGSPAAWKPTVKTTHFAPSQRAHTDNSPRRSNTESNGNIAFDEKTPGAQPPHVRKTTSHRRSQDHPAGCERGEVWPVPKHPDARDAIPT